MADDNDKPHRSIGYKFKAAIQKLIHPKPKAAAPAPLPTEALTPGGNSGQTRPAIERPPAGPLNDEGRQQLAEQVALRRSIQAGKEQAAREQLQKEHGRQTARQRAAFEASGVSGIQRLPAELELKGCQAAEVASLGTYYADQWDKTNAAIAEAEAVGHFDDGLSEAFDRAAFNDAGRGEYDAGDDGGRYIGD